MLGILFATEKQRDRAQRAIWADMRLIQWYTVCVCKLAAGHTGPIGWPSWPSTTTALDQSG